MTPMTEPEEIRFRPNVAGIIQRGDGHVLICERMEPPGAWQFPQGGVDPGETYEEAFRREMVEEISLPPAAYAIVDRKGPYRYRFAGGRLKHGYHGQEQHYFVARLKEPEAQIDLCTDHPEFRDFRWIAPGDFNFDWVPDFKKEVYRAVFRDFFGIGHESA
ncbi:MAG TPA: RNA pyrophosphohydrolase [Chthoniobacteraceae bacterium]|nr:RNA pyrophosphohydrolase [Chthoniobacteraceae bacterium]